MAEGFRVRSHGGVSRCILPEAHGHAHGPSGHAVGLFLPLCCDGPGDRLGRQEPNAFDFADLILQPWRLLSGFPDVLDEYRARFEYVMVDEFQDTDRAQYSVLKLICPEEANLCVVGDDDQSIYMWRDADVSNILGFRKDYPTAKTVKLERNYRSTQSILEAAASVIAKNKRRHEKTLWTEIPGGEPVDIHDYLPRRIDHGELRAGRSDVDSQETGHAGRRRELGNPHLVSVSVFVGFQHIPRRIGGSKEPKSRPGGKGLL